MHPSAGPRVRSLQPAPYPPTLLVRNATQLEGDEALMPSQPLVGEKPGTETNCEVDQGVSDLFECGHGWVHCGGSARPPDDEFLETDVAVSLGIGDLEIEQAFRPRDVAVELNQQARETRLDR